MFKLSFCDARDAGDVTTTTRLFTSRSLKSVVFFTWESVWNSKRRIWGWWKQVKTSKTLCKYNTLQHFYIFQRVSETMFKTPVHVTDTFLHPTSPNKVHGTEIVLCAIHFPGRATTEEQVGNYIRDRMALEQSSKKQQTVSSYQLL